MLNWEPIFVDKNEIKLVKSRIELITSQLYNVNNNSLFGGKAGLAIYYFYLNILSKNSSYKAIANSFLLDCIRSINTDKPDISFSNGICGLSWCLLNQKNNGLIQINKDEFFKEIDIIILTFLENKFAENNFDYLYGGLGSGLYYFERLPSAIAYKSLERIVNLLDQTAEKNGGYITWEDNFSLKDDEPFNKKKYNLGLAHGIPSIICFLSKTYAKGINKSLSKKLLDGSVNWLLKHKCNIANVSIYPEVVYENSNNNFSRLAWCNGDLGVAICLWQAGNSLGKKSLLEESLVILDSSISRTHKMETLVMDNCLCHGATGIAHIYNNFYQITKLKKIKTAAINWYKVVLEMKSLTDDSGFYKTWSIDDNDIEVWTNNCGILNGVAGIGLSLISSISKIKPSWDSCLLLR